MADEGDYEFEKATSRLVKNERKVFESRKRYRCGIIRASWSGRSDPDSKKKTKEPDDDDDDDDEN